MFGILKEVTVCKVERITGMENERKTRKKLDFTDRMYIEMGLSGGDGIQQIADKLNRNRVSIAREILKNRTLLHGTYPLGNDCRHIRMCYRKHKCDKKGCNEPCYLCGDVDCKSVCEDYTPTSCKKCDKPPYVCNYCNDRKVCQDDRYFYSAKKAQAAAEKRRSASRSGIRIKGEEFDELNATLYEYIKKGQPISHICHTHGDKLHVTERTIYNYIANGDLTIRPIDLRRMAGYRARKKKRGVDVNGETPKSQVYRLNRTYADYQAFMKDRSDMIVTEMDTVKGTKAKGNVLLTMIMRRNSIMLLFLMPDGTQESVIRWIDFLEEGLGEEAFNRLFGVFLTDNGSEFKDVDGIELNSELRMRTHVFYCDPMASWQKPHIEKNHEYIRYVIPKGTNLNQFTEDDITLLMNHINSTRRSSLGGKCPYDLIDYKDKDMLKLMRLMNMDQIPPRDVFLKPALLSHKTNS